jgi:hypothetical protein
MTIIGRRENLDGRHTYVHPVTGEIFPAVGSILSSTNEKYWKADWASKIAAEWTVDHLPFVAESLAQAGRDATVTLVKTKAREGREFKADVGSYVHSVIEVLILGGGSIPPIPDKLLGQDYGGDPLTLELVESIVDGFMQFAVDFDVEFEFSEVTVCNRRKRYAGTLDMGVVINLGAMGCLRLVVDAKTGAILEWTMRHQQAAYSDPDNEMWLPNGQVMPLPEYEGAAILHLRRDYERGYKLLFVTPEELVEARHQFDAMRRVYEIQQTSKGKPGRVIYPPLADGTQPPPLIEDLDGIPGFGRCRNKLLAAGLRSLHDLAALTVVQAKAIDGVGPKALQACTDALRAYGFTWADHRTEQKAEVA